MLTFIATYRFWYFLINGQCQPCFKQPGSGWLSVPLVVSNCWRFVAASSIVMDTSFPLADLSLALITFRCQHADSFWIYFGLLQFYCSFCYYLCSSRFTGIIAFDIRSLWKFSPEQSMCVIIVRQMCWNNFLDFIFQLQTYEPQAEDTNLVSVTISYYSWRVDAVLSLSGGNRSNLPPQATVLTACNLLKVY